MSAWENSPGDAAAFMDQAVLDAHVAYDRPPGTWTSAILVLIAPDASMRLVSRQPGHITEALLLEAARQIREAMN